jgi:large subunit ribosomal protein L15
MRLEELRPTKGSMRRRKRVGRGYGSGRGGHESGKGTKGQNSRSGNRLRPGFEGGQTPIWMRFPKRGFRNPNRVEYACVNLEMLEERFPPQGEVTLEALREAGLVKGRVTRLKILGGGELTKPLTIRAHRYTRSAREKIELAGGKAEVV